MPDNPTSQLRMAVCDDESTDRQQMEKLAAEIMEAERLPYAVSSCASAAALLPERSFTFCHWTIWVNPAFIKHLRSREIELAGGETLPASKYHLPDLKKWLLAYPCG